MEADKPVDGEDEREGVIDRQVHWGRAEHDGDGSHADERERGQVVGLVHDLVVVGCARAVGKAAAEAAVGRQEDTTRL